MSSLQPEAVRIPSPGGHTGGETPGPIPNPEVKPSRADGTALETARESRSLPGVDGEKGEESLPFLYGLTHLAKILKRIRAPHQGVPEREEAQDRRSCQKAGGPA